MVCLPQIMYLVSLTQGYLHVKVCFLLNLRSPTIAFVPSFGLFASVSSLVLLKELVHRPEPQIGDIAYPVSLYAILVPSCRRDLGSTF